MDPKVSLKTKTTYLYEKLENEKYIVRCFPSLVYFYEYIWLSFFFLFCVEKIYSLNRKEKFSMPKGKN